MTHERILEELKERYDRERITKPMTFIYEVLYSVRNKDDEVIGFTQADIVQVINETNSVRWGIPFVSKMLKQLTKDGFLYRKVGTNGGTTKYAFPKEDFFEKPIWIGAEKFDSTNTSTRIRSAFNSLKSLMDDLETAEQCKEFTRDLKREYIDFLEYFEMENICK